MTKLLPLAIALVAFALSMGALCEPGPTTPENTEPIARVVWPQIAKTGEPVFFDGAQSTDNEGPILRYEMTFGDGTEARTSNDGTFEHTFAEPGSYSFLFSAADEDGWRGEVQGTVVLTDVLDDPACDCTLRCLNDAICTPSGCVLTDTSASVADAGASENDVVVDDELSCGAP